MSGMYGADVAQLRALAQQFDSAAARLDAGRGQVGHAIQIRAWFGPAAVQFRHAWDSQHSRSIHAVADRLRDAAHALRANADAQERTSAAGGGAIASGTGHRATTVWEITHETERPGPSTPGEFVRELADMSPDDDGVRIQKIIGPDGVARYVVYIDGSGSTGFLSANLGWQMNVPNAVSLDNYTLDIVRSKIASAIDDPSAEVAIFGFSQGGLVAQRLADEGSFNTKLVVTCGSPVLQHARNYGGADILRFEHLGDVVPRLSVENPIHDLVVAGMDNLTGNRPPTAGTDRTYSGGGFDLASHNAAKYAELVDAQAAAEGSSGLLHRSLSPFAGTVIADEK